MCAHWHSTSPRALPNLSDGGYMLTSQTEVGDEGWGALALVAVSSWYCQASRSVASPRACSPRFRSTCSQWSKRSYEAARDFASSRAASNDTRHCARTRLGSGDEEP